MYTISESIVERLKVLAALQINNEDPDFNAYEASGGNYDDAYALGSADGEILLAREILREISFKEAP